MIDYLLGEDFSFESQGELDAGSPEFQSMADAVFTGNYGEASAKAAELLSEGLIDIRLIAYYVLGLIEADGLPALVHSVDALVRVFELHWEVIGPEQRKESHAKATLSMLFETSFRRLDARTESRAAWDQHVEECLDLDAKASLLDALERLLQCCAERELGRKVLDPLSKLQRFASSIEIVVPEEAPLPGEELAASPYDTSAYQAAELPSQTHAGAAEPSVSGSVHLDKFLRKLEAFRIVAQQGDLYKAAIIARDINAAIDTFDPRVYLPALFTDYYRLMGQHIDELAEYWSRQDELNWKVSEQLYHVDLESFIKN
ncbi:MAG: type VI secretion system protein IglI family protein [Myxococcota bacterium]